MEEVDTLNHVNCINEMKIINIILNRRTETRAGFPGSEFSSCSSFTRWIKNILVTSLRNLSIFGLHTWSKTAGKSTTGFTIIEAILSAFIISLAVIGPLAAARQGLAVSSDSRDYTESIYLAEEATEFIRNVRNENLLKGRINNDWLHGLDKCMGNGKYCGVSPISNNPIVSCSNGNNECELTVNSGVYSHNSTGGSGGWTLSGITRKIQIIEKVANVDAEIIVSIERKKPGFPTRYYRWRSILMNWMRSPS